MTALDQVSRIYAARDRGEISPEEAKEMLDKMTEFPFDAFVVSFLIWANFCLHGFVYSKITSAGVVDPGFVFSAAGFIWGMTSIAILTVSIGINFKQIVKNSIKKIRG